MKGKKIAVRWRMAWWVALALGTFALVVATAQQGPPAGRRSQAPRTAGRRAKAPPVATASANKSASPSASDGPSGSMVEAIRDNNLGVALMDQHNFQEAFALFQTACIMAPDSEVGCINSGIALLHMQQYDEARKILSTAAARDPQNPRVWFNLGLLERAQGQTDTALADLEKAAALDPQDAATQCLLGLGYAAQGNYDHAASAFKEALRIDPLNATAESGLADIAAKTGDVEGQRTHLARYRELTTRGISRPLGGSYGQQGKYSLAAELSSPDEVAAPIPVHFVDVTARSGLATATRAVIAPGRGRATTKPTGREAPAIRTMADFLGSGACVFDYDGDGRPDIFLVNADGRGNSALFHNLGHDRFADVTKIAKLNSGGEGMGCAVGDYDNDGQPDLAVSSKSGVRLYHNQGKGVFADVTKASGIQVDGLALGLAFIDYDRDGHLDLYVTRFRDFPLEAPHQPFTLPEDAAPGNMLWRNQGTGKFVDVTTELAVGGDASSTGMIAADLTRNGLLDGALDFLLTGFRSVPEVLMNPREGAFLPAVPWGAETQPPTAGGVGLDFNKDGYTDIALTHWAPTTLGLWRNVDGKSFEHVAIPDPGWMRAWGIAALDYDNDGWIDLVAVGETFSGEGRMVLLRNQGGKGFHDVTHDTGLDKIVLHDPRSVIAFDAQGDGALDLLITQNHRPPVLLESVGANQNNWAEIDLHGDPANTMGVGVSVEMFSGALRQTWEMPGASGYLSQGPSVIHAGLGQKTRPEAVRVLWPQGSIQVQRGLTFNKRTTISQQDSTEP